jgi:hypothetical protein
MRMTLTDIERELKRGAEGLPLDFEKVLRAACQSLPGDDLQLATAFDVSCGSLLRWKSGASVPSPLLRRHVCGVLLVRLQGLQA